MIVQEHQASEAELTLVGADFGNRRVSEPALCHATGKIEVVDVLDFDFLIGDAVTTHRPL